MIMQQNGLQNLMHSMGKKNIFETKKTSTLHLHFASTCVMIVA
jgi:hypothetical protein